MKDSILMILQIPGDFDLWSGSLLSLCVTCFRIRSTECKKNIQCIILTKSVNCAAGSLHQAIVKVHIHFPIDCMNAWIWIVSHQKCIFTLMTIFWIRFDTVSALPWKIWRAQNVKCDTFQFHLERVKTYKSDDEFSQKFGHTFAFNVFSLFCRYVVKISKLSSNI